VIGFGGAAELIIIGVAVEMEAMMTDDVSVGQREPLEDILRQFRS